MANAKPNKKTEEVINQPAAEPAPESIGLGDLAALMQIVDLASQRGAFRGTELSQVGVVYDKLARFLSYVESQQKELANKEEK